MSNPDEKDEKLLYALRVLHFDRAWRRRIDYDVEDTVVNMLIAEVSRFPVPPRSNHALRFFHSGLIPRIYVIFETSD